MSGKSTLRPTGQRKAFPCVGGASAYTITNLRRNKSITMNTLEKLCQALDCTPNDVVRFLEEPEKHPIP